MILSAVISGLLLTLYANCQQAANTNQPSYDPILAILGNLSRAQNGSDPGFIRKDSRHSDIFIVGRSDGQRTTFGTYENKGFFAQTGFDKSRSTGNQSGTTEGRTHYYSIGGAPVPVVPVPNNQSIDTSPKKPIGSPKRPIVSPFQPGSENNNINQNPNRMKPYQAIGGIPVPGVPEKSEILDVHLRPPTTPYPVIGGKPVGVTNTENSWSKPRPGNQWLSSYQSISSSPVYLVDKYSHPHYGNNSKSSYYAADPSIGGHPVDLIQPNFKNPLLNQKLLSQAGVSTRIGISQPDFDAGIEGDTETFRLDWQVSVFNKEVKPYVRVCGGSIVTSTAVISAAQCFWGVGALPASQYAVGAVALDYPNTTTDEYSSYQQRIDVRDLKIPPRFRGLSSNNQADVAVLLMEKPFHFHHSLKPVCVFFDYGLDEELLRDGSVGAVLGRGSSGTGSSPILLNHRVPIISYEQCLQETTEEYLNLITGDKICAGVKSTPPNARICNHDIGSGLFFIVGLNPVPFLRGVASSPLRAATCSAYSVNTYTRLQSHMSFLVQHVPNVENECWNHYPHVYMILKDRFGSQNDEIDGEIYEDGDEDEDGKFVCNCYC